MTATATSDEWWARAFASDYLEIYAHRDDRAAAGEIAGLLPRLARLSGPVLDAGCGAGRHLETLRAAGVPAFGLDYSRDLLQVARGRALTAGCLLRADLRAPPLASGWGAILLLFTSFGYFDDAGNAACLAGLARLLGPGGRLVVDLPSAAALRQGLVASSTRQVHAQGSSFTLEERRWWEGQRVVKELRYRGRCWQESVRIYEREEFIALARHSGLDEQDCWSALAGPGIAGDREVHWLARGAGELVSRKQAGAAPAQDS